MKIKRIKEGGRQGNGLVFIQHFSTSSPFCSHNDATHTSASHSVPGIKPLSLRVTDNQLYLLIHSRQKRKRVELLFCNSQAQTNRTSLYQADNVGIAWHGRE